MPRRNEIPLAPVSISRLCRNPALNHIIACNLSNMAEKVNHEQVPQTNAQAVALPLHYHLGAELQVSDPDGAR